LGIEKAKVATYKNIENIIKEFAKNDLKKATIVYFGNKAKEAYDKGLKAGTIRSSVVTFADNNNFYVVEPKPWSPIHFYNNIAYNLAQTLVFKEKQGGLQNHSKHF